jgi:hypothetical protein
LFQFPLELADFGISLFLLSVARKDLVRISSKLAPPAVQTALADAQFLGHGFDRFITVVRQLGSFYLEFSGVLSSPTHLLASVLV